MTVDTQKLREAAANAKDLTAEDLSGFPLTATAHIEGLARAIESCCDHIDAQAAEIDGLRAELEHRSAYWITHKGAVLACSNSMRDAYSDEKVRADAAEAEIARLRADQAEKDAEILSLKHELASMRFRLSGVDMRRQEPIARAALSGESNAS